MPSGAGIGTIKFREDDANGQPLAGGKLTCYQAGTSTLLDTYNDPDLADAHKNTNPVILDAAGRALIFLQARAYRFVLTDANNVPVYDVPSYSSYQPAGGAGGIDIAGTLGEDGAINEVVVLSDGTGGRTAGRWYRGDADDADLSANPGRAGFMTAAALSGEVGFIRVDGTLDGFVGLTAGLPYYISTAAGGITLTEPTNSRPVGVAMSTTVLIVLSSGPPVAGFDFMQARIFG